MKLPNDLLCKPVITESGITIYVNNEPFPIAYEKEVWSKTSLDLKNRLASNLAMASTLYLPQILSLRSINYDMPRPVGESFFLRNGIYDAPYCAQVDGNSSIKYLKDFFNTRYLFTQDEVQVPSNINFEDRSKFKENGKKSRALVLFSFGKESLLSFALCKELNIEPVLVTIVHPGFEYEWLHKKPLVDKFQKEHDIPVHVVDYQPGILKEGKYFGLSTELGWGLHVTEYALLALPFAEVFDCDYIICGNEQSCNDIYYDKEDVLIYRAGLDQHHDWTKQQGFLQSLIMGRSLPAYSFLEPLYEISETKILHSRYKDIGKYQMSCFASAPGSKDKRWCQQCEKCAYMYALFKGFAIDTKSVGFADDLFDKNYLHLYENFFSRTDDTHFYGSQGELGLGFYSAIKNGATGAAIDKFKAILLNSFEDNFLEIRGKYLGIHTTNQMPKELHPQLISIFHQELDTCLAA